MAKKKMGQFEKAARAALRIVNDPKRLDKAMRRYNLPNTIKGRLELTKMLRLKVLDVVMRRVFEFHNRYNKKKKRNFYKDTPTEPYYSDDVLGRIFWLRHPAIYEDYFVQWFNFRGEDTVKYIRNTCTSSPDKTMKDISHCEAWLEVLESTKSDKIQRDTWTIEVLEEMRDNYCPM